MNRKILTTAHGNVLQITLSPWEVSVLLAAVSQANIPSIVSKLNVPKKYLSDMTDNIPVGIVLRDFYNILEK